MANGTIAFHPGPNDQLISARRLRPLGSVSLNEAERVRLIIERTEQPVADREVALERLRAGIGQMRFYLSGPLPSRDELHDRV